MKKNGNGELIAMKRNAVKIFALILIVCVFAGSIFTVSFSGYDDMEQVQVWRRIDIVLQSAKEYNNPYIDVDIDATFTHGDGTSIHLYGFWNGENEWRVRFSPTKTGVWDYVITCTDTSNNSLHNVKGKILATENTNETDIDKHGFIKISDNGRYFVYDDGTPFYWLGDTNWQAPNYVSITKCNYPGCDCGNQFRHEVNDRLSKGFTVYQTYFDSSESDGGGQRSVSKEPSMWKSKYKKINPQSFTDKYDKMFDYLADNGVAIALGFGVHNSTTSAMKKDELDRLSRYLTARYAAYPVVWITAQEITGETHFDAWLSSARVTDEGDGYNHPQTAHQYPLDVNNEFVKALGKESWHDFYALQNGHGPSAPKKSTYKGYYNNKVNGGYKPFVETESNYEDIYCGGFNGYNASRVFAWKANLCGSCGFTYGVTGIWANCWSTVGSTGWLGTYSTEPWYMGLDKPGSYEMKYMADFFKYVGFEKLIPRFDSKQYSDFNTENKVVASSEDNSLYVAYFCNKDLSTGTLKGLNSDEKYIAEWYDPLTGAFTLISEGITPDGGSYKIPEKPNTSDWAFLLTSKTLTGTHREAPLPDLMLKNEYRSENVLTYAKTKASSSSGSGSSAGKSIDGKENTWWCAASGEFPQWILYDMVEQKEFNTLSLEMYGGTTCMSYKIEVSDGGNIMRTVYVNSKAVPDAAGSSTFTATLDKTEKCRLIKITFEEVIGNWAAVIEADAYKAEVPETGELPTYAGTLQTPDVWCTGGCIYTTDTKMKNTAENLTDNDLSTVWTPFAAEATQTVKLDLKEEKYVTGLNIILGRGTSQFDFRVMGSNDGEAWTILSDTDISGLDRYKLEGRNAMSAKLSGNYRYLKIIFMGAASKDTKKNVAELRLYADVKRPEDTTEQTTEIATENGPTEAVIMTDAEIEPEGTEKKTSPLPFIIGGACLLAAVCAVAVFAVLKKCKKA